MCVSNPDYHYVFSHVIYGYSLLTPPKHAWTPCTKYAGENGCHVKTERRRRPILCTFKRFRQAFVVLFFNPFCDVTLLKTILWLGLVSFGMNCQKKTEMKILIQRLTQKSQVQKCINPNFHLIRKRLPFNNNGSKMPRIGLVFLTELKIENNNFRAKEKDSALSLLF